MPKAAATRYQRRSSRSRRDVSEEEAQPAAKPGPRFSGNKFLQKKNNFTVDFLAKQVLAERKTHGKNRGYVHAIVDAHNATQRGDEQITYMQVSKRLQRLKAAKTAEADADIDVPPQPLIQIPTVTPAKQHGRPKGSTIEHYRLKKEVRIHIRNNITILFKRFLDQQVQKEMEDPRSAPFQQRPLSQAHAFKDIRRKVVDKYKLQYDFVTDNDFMNFTIGGARSRINRHRLKSRHAGYKTPLADVEPYVAQLCIRASRCMNSLTIEEVIGLANGLIKGTDIETRVVQRRLKCCPVISGTPPNEVGREWFRGFLRRYPEVDVLSTVHVNKMRESWCTYPNLRDMYKLLFGYWEDEQYIERLPVGQWQDIDGEAVPVDDPNRLGRKVRYKWKYPERMLVADECGHNTNMDRDKVAVASRHRVGERGTKAAVPSATDDVHFTCLCFTNMLGTPVLMVTIVAQKEPLSHTQLHGVDVNAPWIGAEVFETPNTPIPEAVLAANTGPGKYFPGSVTTSYNGTDIPSLMFHNEKGTMTSTILMKILKHIDSLEIFERIDGVPPPGLLLDGHGSRFGLDFLSYINNTELDGTPITKEDHKWNAYIGLPWATHVWQVADAAECNGNWKEQLRSAGAEIRDEQRRNQEEIRLEKHHIVAMIKKAFPNSFGHVPYNKRAIAKRGWNPLNRNCLLLPTLVNKRPPDHVRYDSEDELDEELGLYERIRPCVTDNIDDAWFDSINPPKDTTVNVTPTQSQSTTSSQYDDVIADSLTQLLEVSSGQSTRSEAMIRAAPETVHKLNVSESRPFDVILRCLASDNRNRQQELELVQRRKKQKEIRAAGTEQLQLLPKLTAGSEAKNGNLWLNNPEVAMKRRFKTEQKEAAVERKAMEVYIRDMKIFENANRVRRKKKAWTQSDIAWMIKYKEYGLPKSNEQISTRALQRELRWNECKDLPSPARPRKPEGLEDYLLRKQAEKDKVAAAKEVRAAEQAAAQAIVESSFEHLK